MVEQSHNQQAKPRNVLLSSHNTMHAKEAQIRKEVTAEEALHTRLVSDLSVEITRGWAPLCP